MTVDTPMGGVEAVIIALEQNIPPVQGQYDCCTFAWECGYQRFRVLAGSHAGAEGTIQNTPAAQIVFSIPQENEILYRTFDVIFAAHVNEEPSVRLSPAWDCRSKPLVDGDNPNRYWNRPDATELHGASVG